MDSHYPFICKHLGKERLKKEIKFIEAGEWAEQGGISSIASGYLALKVLDLMIQKNEALEGFEKWAKDARHSKDIKDCFFELVCVNHFAEKGKVVMQKKKGVKVLDALICDEGIYLEMTNLESMPEDIWPKVNDLGDKSQEKFGESLGLHLVGVNGFYEYSQKEEKLVPKKELQILVNDLEVKLRELDKNILGFFLWHSYFDWIPGKHQFAIKWEFKKILRGRKLSEEDVKTS